MPTAEGHWGDKRSGEDPDVYYYDGQELLEVSVVNIPANANAVRRSIEGEQGALPPKPAPAADPIVDKQEESKDNSDVIIARANIARAMFHK